jgi:hypothetical protein
VHTIYELREEIFGLAQDINQFLNPLTHTPPLRSRDLLLLLGLCPRFVGNRRKVFHVPDVLIDVFLDVDKSFKKLFRLILKHDHC